MISRHILHSTRPKFLFLHSWNIVYSTPLIETIFSVQPFPVSLLLLLLLLLLIIVILLNATFYALLFFLNSRHLLLYLQRTNYKETNYKILNNHNNRTREKGKSIAF